MLKGLSHSWQKFLSKHMTHQQQILTSNIKWNKFQIPANTNDATTGLKFTGYVKGCHYCCIMANCINVQKLGVCCTIPCTNIIRSLPRQTYTLINHSNHQTNFKNTSNMQKKKIQPCWQQECMLCLRLSGCN